MELRPLTRKDHRLYERTYTDPSMWVELGGVLEQDMAAKLERDVASVEADRDWVLGWMVLPEHQGRGIASAAVAEALRWADEAARWQTLHAFPATTNAPSNALCRKHGFALRGPIEYAYREQTLRVNHWLRDTLSYERLRVMGTFPGHGPPEDIPAATATFGEALKDGDPLFADGAISDSIHEAKGSARNGGPSLVAHPSADSSQDARGSSRCCRL